MKKIKQPAVYIMASKKYGVLYTGVTIDLVIRAIQHKQGCFEGFSKNFNCKVLVYYEYHDNMLSAIKREKQIKKWKRSWKIKLIESQNPTWQDLYGKL